MHKLKMFLSVTVIAFAVNGSVLANKDKTKELPPGLQKKVENGKALPPGWQKKIQVGQVVDEKVYSGGKVIARGEGGTVTINVEGKVFTVIENTREIIDILTQ